MFLPDDRQPRRICLFHMLAWRKNSSPLVTCDPYCLCFLHRETYQAKSGQVAAVITAANARLRDEVKQVKCELENRLAAVKAEAAKSAAKAKADRQTSHIAGRQQLQEDAKEIVADRSAQLCV